MRHGLRSQEWDELAVLGASDQGPTGTADLAAFQDRVSESDPLAGTGACADDFPHSPLTTNVSESLAFVRSTDPELAKTSGLPAAEVEDLGSMGKGVSAQIAELKVSLEASR